MTSSKRSKTYFYMDEKIYRYINLNRALGMVYVWDLEIEQKTIISHSDFKKRAYWAYTSFAAAEMMNQKRRTIDNAIRMGFVPEADFVSYGSFHTNKHLFGRRVYLSKTAIRRLHSAISLMNQGVSRKDATIKKLSVPTREELDMELNNDIVLYAKSKDGKSFVRVWEAEDFT